MKTKWISGIAFAAGLILLTLPIIGSFASVAKQKNAIATYERDFKSNDKSDMDKMLEEANHYNSMLFQSSGAVVDDMDHSILSDESYQKILSPADTGIMGSIKIPKIDVNIPIYHGTSDEALSNGAGHQQGTSLPVGGQNTHCVLSAHRGLPGSKLFTRLDEISKGDLFFLSVCGETLAYKVYKIEVVEPDNVEVMNIEAGKDEVSLVTCTPYGLNTHRMVVTGERVPFEKTEYESIRSGIPSLREITFIMLPFIAIAILINRILKSWRSKKL